MTAHAYYLEELVKNLASVKEDPLEISWIMKEGIYYKEQSKSLKKMCDLVFGYYTNHITLIELKGSRQKRSKAISQLESGFELIQSHFKYNSISAKVVYYDSRKGYSFENINL